MARRNTLRPIPDDFATVVQGRTNIELRAYYSAGNSTISRWIKESAVVRARKPYGRPTSAPPADIAELAKIHNVSGLAKHYGAGFGVVVRWLGEVGISAVKYTPVPPPPHPKLEQRKPRASRAKPAVFGRMGRLPPLPDRRPVTSVFEEARDYLATALRCPVYRCDFPNGRPNTTGHYWRVGMVVYTPADLLAYAKRKGFGKPFEVAA